MSQKFTITLNEEGCAALQKYVEECNKHTNWQNPENAIVEIVYSWLSKRREHKEFMAQLEKDVEEIHARKAKA